ncbi:transglutaminase family protein [Pontibacter harenae]|uniref:transglutaminase family protein n=1 Tax=Pontibacter harenae TaxID=2894083 RepID=UPI001E454BF1|nr:transglutaminase family protein [Pontibacter harenae]MCC9168930.1 transglutaminase family protein [Pontibacter harenae]
MPEFNIKHITKYTYEALVRDSVNHIILYPWQDEHQKVVKHDLRISGNPKVDTFIDYYGNQVGFFTYSERHKELEIYSELTVATFAKELPNDETAYPEQQWKEIKDLRFQVPYIDYLKWETFDSLPELRENMGGHIKPDITPYRTALNFCSFIYEKFSYIQGVTTVQTQLNEIWQLKAGVCQDFAHILAQMLRMADIPAKYVSGYICPNKNGIRGEGATHAWVEAYLPSYGWLGLDPTNNCIANETYVKLAVGRSFNDCSPVKGVYKGPSKHKLTVQVIVSYDNGQSETIKPEFQQKDPEPIADFKGNSYRRNLELMQKQQQQQQQ